MHTPKGLIGLTLARYISLFIILGVLAACSTETDRLKLSNAEIELNNRGVALMGRFDYRGAADVFAKLVNQRPEWHTARTNYAIALKNRQGEGDAILALEQLSQVLQEQPENAIANYNSGVLRLYLGQVEPAEKHFKSALEADPNDAYAHYYLGQCQLRTGDRAGALSSYQQSIELDPYLRSAYYSASQVLRRLDRPDDASKQLAIFQRFENNPRAKLAEFKYTRMGPKSIAAVSGQTTTSDQKLMPTGSLLAKPKVVATLATGFSSASLTTVDFNQDGAQDLFLASGSQGSVLLTAEIDAKFTVIKSQPWAEIPAINAVAWGDVDNNGFVDVYLCRAGENQLWLQTDAGKWDQSLNANLADGENDCADVAMLDADHDGDLDILIANRGASDNLLNNNRDGTFRSLADKLLTAAEVGNTSHILVTDLDSDSDVDIIFVAEDGSNTVLLNDRLWNYRISPNFAELSSTALQSLTAIDVDSDGQNELLSLDASGELSLWRADNHWKREVIYKSKITSNLSPDISPIDLNGNGHSELLLIAEGAFEILGISDSFDVSHLITETYSGGKAIPVILGNRGSSLVAYGEGDSGTGQLMEWSPGEGRFEFITLSFTGKHDAAETMRSNHSGIGTRVSVRKGPNWSVADTHKHSSLRGQSLQPLAIGMAGRENADFIAVDWSDGVYQTELDIPAGSQSTIAEEQRQLGSCPVLFVWNGEKFDFVTDILGVAAQGFLVEPGTLLPPRPWERIAFEPGVIADENGLIQFKITEPMEENSYIDSMTLESYDVPEGWEIVLDERMGSGAPEVTGETLFFRKVIEPSAAFDSKGRSVLADIKNHDQRAMPPGDIDRRFIGLLREPESITLEFDQPLKPLAAISEALPVLMAESWIELPYSQTHFSAWQAGRKFQSVSLDARDRGGNWRSVHPQFGIPAGMPRTISLPLAEVPEGSTAIRLSWNREIYWDRIRVVYSERAPSSMIKQTMQPSLASVGKSGFYKRVNHEQRRPEYVYQDAKTFGDVKYPTGFYTSIGEMTELITKSDDALAIIGPGEEIHVEFEVSDQPAEGFKRWYVLETKGWAKDKDMYTHTGATVEPLPRTYPHQNSTARDTLHPKYNTRFQSGR